MAWNHRQGRGFPESKSLMQAVSGFDWPRERAIGMESATALAIPDVRTSRLVGLSIVHRLESCRHRLQFCCPSGFLAKSVEHDGNPELGQ